MLEALSISHVRSRGARRRIRGFSLTELLVVIGIIVVLVGLLLVALKQVRIRAMRSKTETMIEQFANACIRFHAEHGRYPGVVPDDVLAFTPPGSSLSSTENALLELMGGYRLQRPGDAPGGPAVLEYAEFLQQAQNAGTARTFTLGQASSPWRICVDLRRIGEGPVIDGKPYGPYLSAGALDLAATVGQLGDPLNSGGVPSIGLPDLVDAWGQPVIYLRRVRDKGGPIVADPASGNALPQFMFGGISQYLSSNSLGELGKDQVWSTSNTGGSIWGIGATTDQPKTRAIILAHPAFYKPNNPLYTSARGAFLLWSAGPDGVFLSAHDGPGNPTDPITAATISDLWDEGPNSLEQFDDIRYFGG